MGCTLCGGTGCSTAGLPDYGSESCCTTDIVLEGEACSATQEAPCFISGGCFDDCSHDIFRYISDASDRFAFVALCFANGLALARLCFSAPPFLSICRSFCRKTRARYNTFHPKYIIAEIPV